MVYIEAITADSYFLGVEDGQTTLYVHPMHRQASEALLASNRLGDVQPANDPPP